MDKLYKELAKQHRETMSLDELRERLTGVQELLSELTTNAKQPDTLTVNIDYVIERLTFILIGDVNV